MATTKSANNTSKTTKQYKEAKKGWIDRLSLYFMKRMDKVDKKHPPVTNIRRFIAYFIDFLLSNLLISIPIVFIQSGVTGKTDITQDLSGMELPYVYLICGCVLLLYLFYYVYIPLKVWPGQTPAKRFMNMKIVMLDNRDVTLKALLLRNVIGMAFIEGAVILTTFTLQAIFLTMDMSIPKLITNIFYGLTFLSILVTMTNPNRRMLHDFIAGTKSYKIPEEDKQQYTVL